MGSGLDLTVDGTLVPTRDHEIAKQSKNYCYSTHQVVVNANTRRVMIVDRPLPGNRNVCRSEAHRCCSEGVWRGITVYWNPVRVIVSLVYRVVRKLLAAPAVLLRRNMTKDAELQVLRHENAVLRRQLTRQVRYEPHGSAVVRSTVLADPPAPVGAGVPGDARDAAGVAP